MLLLLDGWIDSIPFLPHSRPCFFRLPPHPSSCSIPPSPVWHSTHGTEWRGTNAPNSAIAASEADNINILIALSPITGSANGGCGRILPPTTHFSSCRLGKLGLAHVNSSLHFLSREVLNQRGCSVRLPFVLIRIRIKSRLASLPSTLLAAML